MATRTGVIASIVGTACCLTATVGWTADWPQWMGPGRDGVWTETGVIDAIPEAGLTVTWRVPAVVLGGAGTLLVVGLWMRWFPALRHRDRLTA